MKRSLHVVALAVLALLLLGPIPDSLAGTPASRLKVNRGGESALKTLAVSPEDAAAYGTGTVIHADALRAGEHSLANLDVAFSGAAFSSAAPTEEYVNEVRRLVTPKLAANAGRGRGTGLELGLASEPIPLIGQLSQAAAPPSTGLIEKVVGPIGIPGVLRAELLRSQAQARSAENACVLGRDQAYGFGSVLNLEVLGGLLSTVARPPLREISQSTSTTRIVPGEAGRLGLRSETRQTIAPVTLFKGTPFQFTIEVLGEWALRATADGAKGSVHYGPLEASPETPIARVLDAKGAVLGQLTTQQLLGSEGLELTIPGVAEIVIGEDPRAVDGDASSSPEVQPTAVSAAADVVRITLLDSQLGDVRIGHMEAAVNVPTGGVRCPGLDVTQTVDPVSVTPGQEFVYTITVRNPNDCTLSDLKLVETPTATPAGVKYELVGSTPSGGDLSGGIATYPDIAPLGPGETKTVTVKVKIPPDSAAGKLSAVAVVTGVCPEEHPPTTDVDGPTTPKAPSGDIPVKGEATVDGPRVGTCIVPALTGLTPAQAKAALEAAGCTLGEVRDGGPGDPKDLGKVIDQGPPASTSVPLGTPVDITVGGPLCTVPSLSGLTPDQAATALQQAGCKLGDVTTGPPAGTPEDAGKIITQNPPAGDKVPIGTEVDVTINPTTCVVPNVEGLTEDAARAQLEAAGCRVGDVTPGAQNPEQAGKVVKQGPTGGTEVPRGTEVDLTVAGPVAAVSAGAVRAGATKVAGQTETRTPSETTPALARTGGVALAGLALWLTVTGLLTTAAGSGRLWQLFGRREG